MTPIPANMVADPDPVHHEFYATGSNDFYWQEPPPARPKRHVSTMFISSILLILYLLLQSTSLAQPIGLREDQKNLSMQRKGNPPMVVLTRTPPAPEVNTEDVEVRDGFKLVDSLDEFRTCLHRDDQKIRLKPGVYTAESKHGKIQGKNSIFGVTGSNNHFDLRGAVIETPASVMKTLPRKAHVPQSWVITGAGNTFEGGYFRNVLDEQFPFHASQNEFVVRADDTTFRGGTFVVKGSFPYGYSDFYGKGGSRWTGLNKHSFMAVSDVEDFELLNADLYHKSFGHGVHFHGTKGGRVEDCNLYGTVRPTNDIIEPGKAVPKGLDEFTEKNVYSPPGRYETVGPAAEHDYRIMYRSTRPIPPNEMIPLTEDGIRSYNNVEDITVQDTYIERFRHCLTLNGPGDYLYENVTVREAGNIAFQTASTDGDVVVRNSSSDVAFSPLVDLTSRAPVPEGDFYEFTVLSAHDPEAEQVFTSTELEAPKSVGSIHGRDTTFVFRNGKSRELPDQFNYIRVAGKGLRNSVLINFTSAEVRLNKKASDSLILSAGPVTGRNGNNKILGLSFEDRFNAALDRIDVPVDAPVRDNPASGDVDGDGVRNKHEKKPFFDTDRDGRVNLVDSDSDGDGLADGREARIGTGILQPDTDGDGLQDGYEVRAEFHPLDRSVPGNLDRDPDQDGLTIRAEAKYETDPNAPDTDGDGLSDGAEVNEYGTDPLRADTDDDGVTDPVELDRGTDPLDPLSKPELRNLALAGNRGDRTTDVGSIADADAHDVDGAFTLSAWVRTTDPSGIILKRRITRADLHRSVKSGKGLSEHHTATAWTGTTDAYQLRVRDGAFEASFTNSYRQTFTLNSGGNIADDQWHHVSAVLYSGSVSVEQPPVMMFAIYVDGKKVGQTKVGGSPMSGTGEIRLLNGWNDRPANALSGMVDEVRLYGRALQPGEIKQIGTVHPQDGQVPAGPLTGREPGLIMGFRFDDGQSKQSEERHGAADLGAEPNDFSRAVKLNGRAELLKADRLPISSK